MNAPLANIFIVTAPSGAGKTSLVKALVESLQGIQVSVSHTTRPIRPGEQNGREYHFVSREEFEKMISADQFIEYANVFGNYYGTSFAAVQSLQQRGVDVILEIDWQGARQARARLEDCLSLFILPPSREILLGRLRGRGTDSDEVIARRTSEAVLEMQQHTESDFLLINDDFDATLEEFRAIVIAQRTRTGRRRQQYVALIKDLLSDA